LLELKSFVEQHLKLHGSWTSPGGEAKVFRSELSDFLIKWYGVSSKKIVIQVDNEERYLELLFQSLLNTYGIDENNEMPSEVIALDDSCTGDAVNR
jgi:ribonuclease HIII